MSEGIDHSTLTNAWGNSDDEFGFMPGLGVYKKGKFKKIKQPDPDEQTPESKPAMTWTDVERYHDDNGVLRSRKITYKFDKDGNKIIIPNE